jgi:hypothetical protein
MPKIKKVKPIKPRIKLLSSSEDNPELEEKVEDSEQHHFQEFLSSSENSEKSITPVLETGQESQFLEDQTQETPIQREETEIERASAPYSAENRGRYDTGSASEEAQYRTAETTPTATLGSQEATPLRPTPLITNDRGSLARPRVEIEDPNRIRRTELTPDQINQPQERRYEERKDAVQGRRRRSELF